MVQPLLLNAPNPGLQRSSAGSILEAEGEAIPEIRKEHHGS